MTSEFKPSDIFPDIKTMHESLAVNAELALSGNLLGGPLEVKNALVDFLRSEAAITHEIRALLADAIENGGNREKRENSLGYAMPNFTIEDLGVDGELGAKILVRRRWFDIGEAIYREIQSIRPKQGELEAAIGRVKNRPGSAGGFEALKKHWAMYKDFLIAKDSYEMRGLVVTKIGKKVANEAGDPDYYECARTIFIEARARNKKAWHKGIACGHHTLPKSHQMD